MYSRLAKHVLKRTHYSTNGSWSPDDFFDIFEDRAYDEEDSDDDDEEDEDSKYSDDDVFTSQPESKEKLLATLAQPEDLEENNNDSITIRKMTENDVNFAARLMVEANRDMYEWTVGKQKLVNVFDLSRTSLERSSAEVYQHRFIAFHDTQPAGVITVVRKDEATPRITCSEACSALGCFRACCFLHMIKVLTYKPKTNSECYIDHICVDSKFRNMGVGGMLLNYVELEAKQWGCESVTLWCHADSRAKSLYERNGYSVVRNADGLCYTYATTGLRKWCKMEKELV
ncbi:uncharacterized protein [Ptychodera flava]|uniref:uncharacterized protein isoform X1 n=1 Tax=Ptychodera flava TaxID=63121 RepID=UPI00396A3666